MIKRIVASFVCAGLALAAGISAQAQTYSNAVMALNPAGYWPLNETAQPPQPLNLTATNLGSLGPVGNGYYGAWYQPSGNTWYLTNNITQVPAVTYPFDGSLAMDCQDQPGQYVIVPRNTNGVANTAVTLNPPFTIEAWLQIGRTNDALGDIVSQGGTVNVNTGGSNTNNPYYGGLGTGWAGVELGQYDDYVFLMCQSTNGTSKSSELDSAAYHKWQGFHVGDWVHVVATFDGSTEVIYTNGVMAGQKTISANAAGLTYVADPSTPLMIGSGSEVSASYGNSFKGAIHDVAIYNSVLPQSSILNHYQAAYGTNATFGANYPSSVLADSPILYYRLNDPQTNVNAGYDSASFPVANNYGTVGAAADGVYQPGTTPGVAGPTYAGFGTGSKAVAINGWLGAVDVGNSNLPAELNPTGTSPLTVVTWFQGNIADAPGRFQELVGHSDNSYRLAMGQEAAGIHFNPGPGPELMFANAADVVTNNFALNDGQWHMAAGVSDGTNEYLYLDGVLAKSAVTTGGINIVGSTRDLVLGGDPQYTYASAGSANTIRNFDGQIAQVAFWTNALSANQIQSLYSAAGVPPSITLQPVSTTNDAGADVTISTAERGSVPLTYQWYQNGVPVANQTNADLVYAPSTVSDAGDYYLIVANSYGSVTSSVATLFLYGAPAVVEQTPADVQVFAGSNPTLHVTASGAQPITYQWSLNGTPIAGATNSSYTVVNAQTTASYTCAMNNSVGSGASTPIALTVLAAPTAPYPARVLADGPIAYYRLDEATGTTAYDYVGGNNATYTNAVLGVSGYSPATDPNETAIELGDYPPSDNYAGNVPSYVDFGTTNGGNAEFTVEAWVTQYLYQNGGDAIVAKGYGNGGEQFVLDTGSGSAGAVRFFVRDAAGNVYGANSTNIITNDGLWHHVVGVCDEAGGHIYLYLDGALAASGSITPGKGILSSSEPLTIGARKSGANTSYDFQFIGKIDDVAIYNTALSSTNIQAQYFASGAPPVISDLHPQSQTADENGTASITVTATGAQPLTYQWYDNNSSPIASATNATLTLSNLATTQSGNYSVTVSDPYGSSSTNASITVVSGAPQLVADVASTNVGAYAGTTNTLSIQVAGTEPFSYQWYQDGATLSSGTNSSLQLAVLAGTNTYYCVITNSYGSATSSTVTVEGYSRPTVSAASYSYHMKIQFTGYDRNEILTNFPVLVRLSTNVPGFDYSQFASASGGDLRFAAADGTTLLASEIDQWNDTNGVSSIWVQVPQLSSTNDYIWAYWGNPNDTTPPASQTNGAVWMPPAFLGLPGYDAVYHLKESGFPYADSTTLNPATNGIAPTLSAGIVGSGELFAVNNFLDAGTINLSNAFTVSAWVNVSASAGSIQTVWANSAGGWNGAGFRLYVNSWGVSPGDGKLLLETGDGTGGTKFATAAGVVSGGNWHLVTAAIDHDGGTASLYVDGSLAASGGTLTDFPNDADVNLGQFTNDAAQFNGSIDEARVRPGLSSDNWIWASYMTVAQNPAFESYGAISSSVVKVNIQETGNNSLVLSWSTGTLESSTNVTGPYSPVLNATSPYTNTVSGSRLFYRVKVQ